jgi:hypothetical protein
MEAEVMSTSPAQYLPGPGPCASVDPVAAGSNSSDASYTRTITIVFGIIRAVLTLFTLVIATLQYRRGCKTEQTSKEMMTASR